MLKKLNNLLFKNNNPVVITNNDNALKRLNKVSTMMSPTDVISVLDQFQKVYVTHRETEVQLKTIEAQKDVLITDIQQQHALYHKVFDQLFEERRMAINKSFEVIDQGLKNNDRELVNIGMRGLSDVVSSSPFANINELSQLIESGQKIKI